MMSTGRGENGFPFDAARYPLGADPTVLPAKSLHMPAGPKPGCRHELDHLTMDTEQIPASYPTIHMLCTGLSTHPSSFERRPSHLTDFLSRSLVSQHVLCPFRNMQPLRAEPMAASSGMFLLSEVGKERCSETPSTAEAAPAVRD